MLPTSLTFALGSPSNKDELLKAPMSVCAWGCEAEPFVSLHIYLRIFQPTLVEGLSKLKSTNLSDAYRHAR